MRSATGWFRRIWRGPWRRSARRARTRSTRGRSVMPSSRRAKPGTAFSRRRPQDHFWCGRLVAQGRVWAAGVVVPPPALDDDLGLGQRVEDLTVEQLVTELAVEALAVAVLPGATGLDVGSLRPHRGDPLADDLGDELRAVVGADVLRHAAQDEQVREHVDDVDRAQLAADPDCQALTGELVDDVEHAVLPSVVGPVLDEIVGPDVVRVLRPQPGAGSVVEPETALL